MNDVYPRSVQTYATIRDDRDLIDAVRKGCGDDVADLLQERLSDQYEGGNEFLTRIREAYDSVDSAIDELYDARSMLSHLKEKFRK